MEDAQPITTTVAEPHDSQRTSGSSSTTMGDKPITDEPLKPVSETPVETSEDKSTALTPLRAHYLKKTLIQLQFTQELDFITTSQPQNVSTLSYLGQPFAPPPKDAPPADLPFIRYIFRQFVLTFPFMVTAPKDFYSDKVQPFTASVLARNLSSSSVLDEDNGESEQATRMKVLAKIERNLSLFLTSATKLVEKEEVVRLSQKDLDRLELLAKKRQAKQQKADIFEVNIVGVRNVMDKGRVRSKIHEEFIIRTRRSRVPDVFVSRRYGDFRTLADELRKALPSEIIPSPPAKDRTFVNMSPVTSTFATRLSGSAEGRVSNDSNESFQSQPSPMLPVFSNEPSRLAREKNRLTLRAYLHALMSLTAVANSPVIKSFLLSGSTRLAEEEMEDVRRREEADRVRDDGRKRFAKEIAARVDGLRDAIKSVKGDLMGKDGLTHIFATIKVTPDVRDLPPNYKAVIEWARISLASTVFHHLVAADDASGTLASLKRLHGLMPYFMLKAALRISNPVSMIRSVLDLFLAQPFGGRSLLQRMFTSSLTEEVKALDEQIEAVKEKINDPVLCEKVRLFVYAPREIQNMYKEDAASEKMHVLTVVLRSGEEPQLDRAQMQRVFRSARAHAQYTKLREALADSDDDDGPQDDDAWLYEDLRILTGLYSRLRDREQLIELIFEGVTSELLKDMITIFYAPLAQVYRAASIADSLGDLQNFINDLIRTVEQVEDGSQDDPHHTVQTFINLIQRHEQAFYSFVHKVHSKGETLFDGLMRWIELFFTVIREGLGSSQISLEFLLPHTGPERANILKEVDAVALYHYKLKVAYETKLRKRFGRTQGSSADAEDEATQALVQGVVSEISFGELAQGDADYVAAADDEDEDEGEGDGSSSEYDSESDDDDEEEESTEEEVTADRRPTAPLRTTSVARSQTVAYTPKSPQPLRSSPLAPQDGRTRQRSLSFKGLAKSKSMTFGQKGQTSSRFSESSVERRSYDLKSLPSVPPLPPRSSTSSLSKPLPPDPSRVRRETRERPAQPAPIRTKSPSRIRTAEVKKAKPEQLKPPDLVHVPQLLPVFTEMMRPLLRPLKS